MTPQLSASVRRRAAQGEERAVLSLLMSVPDAVCVCPHCASGDVGVSLEGIAEGAIGHWPRGWFAFFCFDCEREWVQ